MDTEHRDPDPPAAQLAAENPAPIPHESAAYRAARTALLAEEIALAGRSSGSPPSGAPCRPEGLCRATIASRPRTA